jgi:hypothetical protein
MVKQLNKFIKKCKEIKKWAQSKIILETECM